MKKALNWLVHKTIKYKGFSLSLQTPNSHYQIPYLYYSMFGITRTVGIEIEGNVQDGQP